MLKKIITAYLKPNNILGSEQKLNRSVEKVAEENKQVEADKKESKDDTKVKPNSSN